MKAIAALLLAVGTCAAADDDPVQILARLRDKVQAQGERIPNHVCVETITRDWYDYTPVIRPHSCDDLLGRRKRAGAANLLRIASTDRLRFDVTLADGGEIYSWAGAKNFGEGDLFQLVHTGAVGTGPFAANLLGIFETRDPKFAFEGERTLAGRRLLEYSFDVSEIESRYRVLAGAQWLNSAYTGTLLVDPESASLVRMVVRTGELPKASNLCEVDTTLDYSLVHLGSDDYFLPAATRERFINREGSESENTIAFTSCRDFRGESTLQFGAAPPAATSPAPAASTLALPPGLPVNVELTSPITVDDAAAGDAISGRLAAPIEDAAKRALVPKGAVLTGRLMRVEVQYGHPRQALIVLRWETIEIDGAAVPISLLPNLQSEARSGISIGGIKVRATRIELPPPGEGRYAGLRFSGDHVVVKSGQMTRWTSAQ